MLCVPSAIMGTDGERFAFAEMTGSVSLVWAGTLRCVGHGTDLTVLSTCLLPSKTTGRILRSKQVFGGVGVIKSLVWVAHCTSEMGQPDFM